ncbi:MAG: MFS transporter [Chthoniobacterales bacterium]|nr:MFS transporter [Chthoniobacterales bacterium]
MKNFKSFILTNTLGTFLEYLDATLYAFFASLIASDFFPKENPATGLLMSFGVFSIAFLVRPFGALLFGFLGDRYGRRNILALNILLMAVATMGIGMIPSYAHWGVMAPLSLIFCRILQGLAVSSEYTGSSVYLLETVPRHHGLFSGISTAAASFGIFFASFLAMQLSHFHGEHFWRWIFILCGLVIGGVGFYLRHDQPESPAFVKAKEAQLLHRQPTVVLIQRYRRPFFTGILLSMYIGAALYTILVYSATYLKQLGMTSEQALTISTLLALTEACAAIVFGWLADRWGVRSVLLLGACLMILLACPLFSFVSALHFGRTLLSLGLLAILAGVFDGPIAVYLVSQFDVSVRHSGVSLCYNLGGALVGGVTPVTLTYALEKTGLALFPSFLLIGFGFMAMMVLLQKPKV